MSPLTGNPFLILDYKDAFRESPVKNNFMKGCKWAPDGTCLLVSSEDKKFRIFNISQTVVEGSFNDEAWLMGGWKEDIVPAVVVQEAECPTDFAWYPDMKSVDLTTCCFAVACKDMPVHLWDAWKGELRCSYSSYNHLDELVGPQSVGFSTDCQRLVCGFNKTLRIFNTIRPGKQCTQIVSEGQAGLFSCIAFHPKLPNIFAVGSYAGSIGLYSLETNKNFAIFDGHSKGVTFLSFSLDGTKLFSGTRMDDEILCWDIRNPGDILHKFSREVSTNQRIYLDSSQDSRYLVSGSTDGNVYVWDLNAENGVIDSKDDISKLPASSCFKAHTDCTNGVSIHPSRPLLATSSGQRHARYDSTGESGNSSGDEEKSVKVKQPESTVKLWSTLEIMP